MKYLISLFLGMVVGAAALAALLYFNPFTAQNSLSPLSVTDNELISLNYSAVAADALIFTNDGESQVAPYPAKVLQLWEPPIRKTVAMATVLADSRNQAVGIGIKFSSDSESTNILNGKALVDSVWHIYLPGRGSLFVEQSENYWSYLREIVVPAHWSSGDNWRGIWNGNITSGPGALGTARVVGGSGEFSGLNTEGVESFAAKAYSVEQGPVAISANLAIEIPRLELATTPDP
ncbi:MAG: hypothetical protein OEU90_00175 [Gammaproteobacteria bacterium]|jgi:hypothetical protein|nr:hypothetical protein [Gammaproteobacteria bacterium]MDH3750276.1 hypothetical protein [Gammaproteobacteria bacterium]MDH3803862.1 hypothetical protein [Gammaproteobacteria bacterium]